MVNRSVGRSVAEWDESAPFVVTFSEIFNDASDPRSRTITIDLISLRDIFSDVFLSKLRDHLIDRRNRVGLRTIETEANNIKLTFGRLRGRSQYLSELSAINEDFLLLLASVSDDIPGPYLGTLKRQFRTNPHSPIFAQGLQASDFPVHVQKKGAHGRRIDNILSKALSQAAIAEILNTCDQLYESGEIDIGLYSFTQLSFAVFCRADSYRQIQISDLKLDPKQYFINIRAAKTGCSTAPKIPFQISEFLGRILMKQRQAVVSTFGHLVPKDDIGKLALFPIRGLTSESPEINDLASPKRFAMYERAENFMAGYARQIQRYLRGKVSIGSITLRHTIGTLLAQTGASSQTIQAVLKHATPQICRAYVDIAFSGLVETLSDSMYPAYLDHIPAFSNFRSKLDRVAPERTIRSEDLESGRVEETGACGKEIACAFAPIVCYGCSRFIPYWDADHSINLDIVQREIEFLSSRGRPFAHLVEKARLAKNQIIITINAVSLYQTENNWAGTP